MKIGLDVTGGKAIEQYTSIPDSPKFSKTEKAGAARLDIIGMYTDVNAYGVHGRTTEDLKREAANIDVATARDYMTVMSNTMSGEDYKKAMEDGFDPADMDPEERETILDHIKAVLAESGQIVAGFNDDLSDEQLKDITGRSIDTDRIKQALKDADLPDTPDNVKKISEAMNMMADIDKLTDGSIKFMVENDLRPTVENIYTSTFSASGDGNRQARGYYAEDMTGYLAKKGDDIDWETMKPQIEKAVEQMNIDDMPLEEMIEDAGWLLEKGIPVTEEKMQVLGDIKSVDFPVPARTILKASMEAIADGLSPKKADLSSDHKSTYRKAAEIQSKILSASIGREESRLMMSAEANIRLAKSGVSIDTMPIEDMIKSLKEEEKKIYNTLFGDGTVEENEQKTKLFVETETAVAELPSMPAALIGRIVFDGEITIRRAHTEGYELKKAFESASQTYEAVGTEVRRDLGDSITKAFRNVDDILKDLDLDISPENQRAVRILGYNSMIINEEAVKSVKEADAKLTGVLKALTPGTTLRLIREGVNPMDMKIDELVEHISELDHDPKREAQKYSKFLYKLEKSGKITEKERTSYIGIYRLLNKIERNDHAAVGRLLNSKTDMTFGSLLTVMRSSGKSIDAQIDDDFGLLQDSVNSGMSITDQIEAAFKVRISDPEYNKLEEDYLKENLEQIREAALVDEAVYDELTDAGVDITPDNVMAEEQFLAYPNDLFRNLRAYARRSDRRISDTERRTEKVLSDALDGFAEKIEDKDSTIRAYNEMSEAMTDTLRTMVDHGADSYVDLKSISLMYKQISLAVKKANSENYHIPVLIGDRLTDINLKIVSGEETGFVSATMDTEMFGALQVQVRVAGNRVEANFIGEGKATSDVLKEVAGKFTDRLNDMGYTEAEVRFINGDPKRQVNHKAKNADNNNEAVSNKALYGIAKQFIFSVREIA